MASGYCSLLTDISGICKLGCVTAAAAAVLQRDYLTTHELY